MGHSAGGHLAACVALHGTGHRHEVIDDIKVGIMSVGCTWTSFDTMHTECRVEMRVPVCLVDCMRAS